MRKNADTDEQQDFSSSSSLMAVLFADLVGYSQKVSKQEAETLAFMERCFRVFEENCLSHRGELVKKTGDGVVAIFPTATMAIDFAVSAHRGIERIQQVDSHNFQFRIGIHLGEVQRRAGDVYGHAVNVAARLESEADPGGTCVSHEVFTSARRSSEHGFESMGERKLKNIHDRFFLYRIVEPSAATRFGANTHLLEIETIGGLRVSGPQFSVTLPRSNRSKALLGYLALSPDCRESIDALAAIFWPDAVQKSARQSVRRTVRVLRERLGDAIEVADNLARLDNEGARADLVRIVENVRRGKLDSVLSRDRSWIDSVLAGLDEVSPVFSAWLAVARTDWHNNVASALELSLDRFKHPTDKGLRPIAESLLRIEPTHERAARLLMVHHLDGGNHGAAERIYKNLKSELSHRYGIEPQKETSEVIARRRSTIRPVGTRAAAHPLRIQVRDFIPLTEKGTELFDGFRTELVAGLACFRGWSVVEGVQATDDHHDDCDYALVGKQVDEDSRISILLSLLNAKSNRLIWSQLLDLEGGHIGTAQRRAIGKIAATLEVYISTDRAGLQPIGVQNDVVDAWLKGERLITRWTPESHDEAAGIFTDLIERSPEFAPSYASLASILNVRHVVLPGSPRDANSARRAHTLAAHAVELDPLDARNQLAVAWSAALDDSFDKASVHMDMAARLNPHSPRTLISCAMGFAFFGQTSQALELLSRSLDCAPMLLEYQWSYAAAVYFLANRNENAIEAAILSGDKIVDNPGWHAAALARIGNAGSYEAFNRLVRDVSAIWVGSQSPTPELIIDWFAGIYPIRHGVNRKSLKEALKLASKNETKL